MILGLIRPSGSFTAYDCGNPSPAGIYSPVDAVQCNEAYPTKVKARRLNPNLWNRLKLCQSQQNNSTFGKERTEIIITQNITVGRLTGTCNCSQSYARCNYSALPLRIQILIASWIATIGFMGVVAMWLWARYKIKRLRLSFIPENMYEMEA